MGQLYLHQAMIQVLEEAGGGWMNRDELARRIAVNPRRGVIICHTLVYELVVPSLQVAGIQILHNQPLPFPVGKWRPQFIDGFRQGLG